jgi:hypothetical protein
MIDPRECRTFREFLHAFFKHGWALAPGYRKSIGRTLAREAGARLPVIIKSFPSAHDVSLVDIHDLPSTSVLKIQCGWSRHGVYVLRREESGFFEALRKQRMTEAELLDDLRDVYAKLWRSHKDAGVIVEEWIGGRTGMIPFDYKFFCFRNSTPLIFQIDRNGPVPSIALFQSDFLPYERSAFLLKGKLVYAVPQVPSNALEMLSVAERLAKVNGRAFVSVDLFFSDGEVVFGELTHSPGLVYRGAVGLPEGLDAMMGELWREGLLGQGESIPFISSAPPVAQS